MEWCKTESVRVLVLSAISRMLALLLLYFCGRVAAPYDTSVKLLHADDSSETLHSAAVAWDAVFYQQIAQSGYEYEQFHAFFPLLPALGRLLQSSASLSFEAAGVLISWASFVASTWFLHRVSRKVLGSQALASASVLFYCFTPASVFHAAVYTESLFGALSFLALYLLYCKGRRLLAAAVFAASSAVRSNGIVNAGFVLHVCGQEFVQCVKAKRWVHAVCCAAEALLGFVLIMLPFVSFQYYGYTQYCSNPAYATEPRPWCNDPLPYLYGFVQKHYWGVGFLKYFQLSQVPNFILAAPVLGLSVSAVTGFVAGCPHTVLTLGLLEQPLYSSAKRDSTQHKRTSRCKDSRAIPRQQVGRQVVDSAPEVCWLPADAAVFMFHWAFLALVAFFLMHVQVSTRFLSCSPAVYWYMAHLWLRHKQQWLWLFCFGYMVVGSLLFATFLPWT